MYCFVDRLQKLANKRGVTRPKNRGLDYRLQIAVCKRCCKRQCMV